MTAIYDKLGLNFLYPENWKLIDDSGSAVPHSISLETPDGSCTWTVFAYPLEHDPDTVLKETLAGLQETYEDVEISAEQDQIGGFAASGVSALFYCLDFLVQARLQTVITDEKLFLFWWQAEDRDFEKYVDVFRAISTSVLTTPTNN